MLTRWNDLDRTLAVMEELRRRMDGLFGELDVGPRADLVDRFFNRDSLWSTFATTWPRMNLYDTGTDFLVLVDVPGLAEKDVRLSINQDVLTLEGERKAEPPQGYSVHRQERPSIKFSRSFTLPSKVESDKPSASIRNGVLTITLPKVAEAQPRQIAVKASSARNP